jgi:hypothetical protein
MKRTTKIIILSVFFVVPFISSAQEIIPYWSPIYYVSPEFDINSIGCDTLAGDNSITIEEPEWLYSVPFYQANLSYGYPVDYEKVMEDYTANGYCDVTNNAVSITLKGLKNILPTINNNNLSATATIEEIDITTKIGFNALILFFISAILTTWTWRLFTN